MMMKENKEKRKKEKNKERTKERKKEPVKKGRTKERKKRCLPQKHTIPHKKLGSVVKISKSFIQFHRTKTYLVINRPDQITPFDFVSFLSRHASNKSVWYG